MYSFHSNFIVQSHNNNLVINKSGVGVNYIKQSYLRVGRKQNLMFCEVTCERTATTDDKCLHSSALVTRERNAAK